MIHRVAMELTRARVGKEPSVHPRQRVDVEGVEIEEIGEFERGGRAGSQRFQVGEAIAGVDMDPVADQGPAECRRLRVAIDREHRRARVKTGVSVEQDRALAVARPIVRFDFPRGIPYPARGPARGHHVRACVWGRHEGAGHRRMIRT